ncbi:hypothetical protein BOTNAR_0020g00580 [Botryotinia narcissicola]|uniref:Uncharacterized protein n=1 Tax=Botryotinia narcissicola TaxID=278944 RepID=A0A4Z1J6C5_9HELO|nr:hypothetical protein BOTNAR_0020g00580 [Botryotinia narcissicola]
MPQNRLSPLTCLTPTPFQRLSPFPSESLTTNKHIDYNWYGVFDRHKIVTEGTSFLSTHTSLSASCISSTFSDFLDIAYKYCNEYERIPTEACWFTIRLTKPSDVFVMPRWHRDARMFDCTCLHSQSGHEDEGFSSDPKKEKAIHSKYATTLLGPCTRLLPEIPFVRSSMVEVMGLSCEEERIQLAKRFENEECVNLVAGDIIRFTWGDEDSPVHSEPDSSCSDRVFLCLMFGSEEELRQMCKWRDMEFRE